MCAHGHVYMVTSMWATGCSSSSSCHTGNTLATILFSSILPLLFSPLLPPASERKRRDNGNCCTVWAMGMAFGLALCGLAFGLALWILRLDACWPHVLSFASVQSIVSHSTLLPHSSIHYSPWIMPSSFDLFT